MDRPFAWVVNLDAEEELAHPAGYTPSRAMQQRIATIVPSLATLLGDEVVIANGSDARGCVGRAWCPTPRAVRMWRSAGCEVPNVPSLAVLQRVNGRGFCAALGQSLPGSRFVDARAEVEATVRAENERGDWLLKRAFGYAGRGRRRVHAGALSAHDAAWVDASLREGGVQVEPWVECVAEFALHGWIAEGAGRGDDRVVVWGDVTEQQVDAHGAWVGTAVAGVDALSREESTALRAAATEAARALIDAGYFGAFGVDAYRWRDARGATHFNPRSEITARYSMGWAVGMNGRRPDRNGDGPA